jgi:hypothetical protein
MRFPRRSNGHGVLGFLWPIGDNVTEIGGTAAFGDVGMTDEADCVGTLGLFIAVGEATGLFGTRFFPEGAVTTSEEFGILHISSSIGVDGFEGCARNRIDKFKVGVVEIKNKGKEGNVGGERVIELCWRRMRKSTKLGLKGGGNGDRGGASYGQAATGLPTLFVGWMGWRHVERGRGNGLDGFGHPHKCCSGCNGKGWVNGGHPQRWRGRGWSEERGW